MRDVLRLRRVGSTLCAIALSATCAWAQDQVAEPAQASTETVHPCERHGLSTVLRCIGHDLRHVGSRESLLWLSAGGVVAAGSLLLDDEVRRAFASETQHPVVGVGEHLGEAGLQFGAAFGVYVAGRATNHPAVSDMGVVLIRTQVVNGILTRGLKLLPRARPYQERAKAGHGAFPSGHTSATFATATVLQRRWGWRAGVPAYAMSTFVGVTRLQNVHHLSDVAFGAAVGIVSGLSVTLPGAHTVSPILAPGVAGLSVTIGGQ